SVYPFLSPKKLLNLGNKPFCEAFSGSLFFLCHTILTPTCAMAAIYERNFNPHRCNICFMECPTKPQSTLTPCAGCNMVKYCSKEHKKMDETSHKLFCIAVQKLVSVKNTNHLLRCAESILKRSFQSQPKAIWHHLSLCQMMLSKILRRELYEHERTILTFPAVCAICLEYRPEKLTFCAECHQVAYCGKAHRNADRKNHSKWCAGLRLNYYIDNDLPDVFNNIRDSVDIFTEETFQKPFPTDVFELVNMVRSFNIQKPSDASPALELAEEIQSVKVAGLFSCIGTVLHVLRVTNLIEELTEELNVFVLGSEQDDIFFNPITCAAFFCCLPKLRRLGVFLIGPESCDETAFCFSMDDSRFVEVLKYRCLYHEMPRNVNLPNPHVFVAFNSGLHELVGTEQDTWEPTLRSLFDMPNIPIAFTSYTHGEAIDDSNAIQLYAHHAGMQHRLKYIERHALNPFYDPKPIRNPDHKDEEMLFYLNQYISIVVIRKG
uniref:MYND-type domain-containing protein n=1 Tax=Anopheles dirus TaxID=7168 RepID=A0A182NGL0_9DIPT